MSKFRDGRTPEQIKTDKEADDAKQEFQQMSTRFGTDSQLANLAADRFWKALVNQAEAYEAAMNGRVSARRGHD